MLPGPFPLSEFWEVSVPLFPFARPLFAPFASTRRGKVRDDADTIVRSSAPVPAPVCILARYGAPSVLRDSFVLLVAAVAAQARVSSLHLHRNLSPPLSHFPSSSHIRHPHSSPRSFSPLPSQERSCPFFFYKLLVCLPFCSFLLTW